METKYYKELERNRILLKEKRCLKRELDLLKWQLEKEKMKNKENSLLLLEALKRIKVLSMRRW
jgi:hypothetical protein